MAGNVSTVDGMGFEEVNQDMSFTETISGTNIYGDNLWVNGTAEMNIISGDMLRIDQDASFGDAVDCRTLQVNDREIFSTSYQNAADVYDQRVRAGSVLTGDDGVGLVLFANDWTSTNYFITLTPSNWTLPVVSNEAGSSMSFTVSGTRRASGCTVIGPSGTVADWIAVGI